MMPNYYLSYFYATDHKLAEQAQWPPSTRSKCWRSRQISQGIRRIRAARSRRMT